jgi:putative hydrolase of the HAD superfamily
MIKAVLFDIDGVIIRHKTFFAHTLSPRRYIDPGLVMDSFYGSEINKDCDRGTLDPLLAVRPFLEKMAWKGSSESYFDRQYRHESRCIDFRLLKTIQALRSHGILCCIASNQNYYRREYLKRELKAEKYFDHAFFSSELGVNKPDRLYWKKTHARLEGNHLSLAPGEIVFLDDSPQNVESAGNYGFRSFLISNEQDIKAAFEYIYGDLRLPALSEDKRI